MEFGFAYVFITHDLSLLLDTADTIAIMYAGRIVEIGSRSASTPIRRTPTAAGLLRSFPPLTGPRRELTGIPGFPAGPASLPPGCPFAPRCGHAMAICRQAYPPRSSVGPPGASATWSRAGCHAEHDSPPTAGATGAVRRTLMKETGGQAPVPRRPGPTPTGQAGRPLGGPAGRVAHQALSGAGRATVRSRAQRRVVHAVDDISFELYPGTSVALVGESGSGKSTAGRVVADLDRPPQGGCCSREEPPNLRRRSALEALPPPGTADLPGPVRLAEPRPYGRLPPRAAAAHPQDGRARPRRRGRGCWSSSSRCTSRRPAQMIDKLPHELSGGQRQRVAIARAARRAAERPGRRRAGVDARRLGPAEHPEPARRARRSSATSHCCTSPTTSPRHATSPSGCS